MFLEILYELNIPIKISKLEGLSTKLVFLEFEIDTLVMTASLPKQRKEDLLQYLKKWLNRKSAYSHEIRSLIGYLLWTYQVML